ncbi:MAG: LON peptidase substrate-binding domain-containing protein, partial [Deltaproteobacteria bacterium]|nr:LON peptidase substrate-binding domain-containing protein [Deltaproteobacteria bacterium]
MPSIDSLPLFPLSDVVLLPEISVPLYIFEPRYREMTRDALATDHRIGMATVRPDAVSGMAGDPAIFEIGCLGRIAQSQERPDGTFHILLLGEQRFRILAEHPRAGDRLYRSARVELLTDGPAQGEAEEHALLELRQQMLAELERLLRAVQPDGGHTRLLEGFEALEATRLINALTQAISFRPIEKQQLL